MTTAVPVDAEPRDPAERSAASAARFAWRWMPVGFGIGLVLGLWSFGRPLDPPAAVGEYLSRSRTLLRQAHAAGIELGLVLLVYGVVAHSLRLGVGGLVLARTGLTVAAVFMPLALVTAAFHDGLALGMAPLWMLLALVLGRLFLAAPSPWRRPLGFMALGFVLEAWISGWAVGWPAPVPYRDPGGLPLRLLRLARSGLVGTSIIHVLVLACVWASDLADGRKRLIRGLMFLANGGMPLLLGLASLGEAWPMWGESLPGRAMRLLLPVPGISFVAAAGLLALAAWQGRVPVGGPRWSFHARFGWTLLSLGLGLGLVLGLWSFGGWPVPVPEWLGAYDALPRRLVRLTHGSMVGLGAMNVHLAIWLERSRRASPRMQRAASVLLVAGGLILPPACALVALRPPLQPLLSLGSVSASLGVLLMGLSLRGPLPFRSSH